jgi:hypothetical protein
MNNINDFKLSNIDYIETNTLNQIKNLKCLLCKKCSLCNDIMIKVIQDFSCQYDSLQNMSLSMQFIVGIGGEDTKDITINVFNLYVDIVKIFDINMEYSRDENIIFFKNYKIFKIFQLSESCICKVIRISPFSNKKQTSLFAINFLEMDNNVYQINLNDISFKYTKSSGAGGQNVNKIMSCVIAKHIPTGIQTKISHDRNQTQNKKIAIKILQQKVYTNIINSKSDKSKNTYSKQHKISWGGNFNRIINLHQHKFLKIRSTNKKYTVASLNTLPIIEILFNNIISKKKI